jgi:hypothetical protein
MPRDGFYNDNEYRQFPFVHKKTYAAAVLPTGLIVDCGFIMGIDSGFDAALHFVYLHSVTRIADVYQFEFRTNAPGASDKPLTFTRATTAEEWTTEHVDSAPVTGTTFCATEPAWEGFVVSGDIRNAELANGTTLVFNTERVVEPRRVQSLVNGYLRSISIGNYSREVIPPCATVSSSSSTPREVISYQECLKDNIKFIPGFNCEITQNDNSRTITIAPLLGADTTGTGAAELCENHGELKFFADELPPVDGNGDPRSQFLSGGPACNEVITSINGLPGPNVNLSPGTGIQIVTDAELSTLNITVSDNVISKNC